MGRYLNLNFALIVSSSAYLSDTDLERWAGKGVIGGRFAKDRKTLVTLASVGTFPVRTIAAAFLGRQIRRSNFLLGYHFPRLGTPQVHPPTKRLASSHRKNLRYQIALCLVSFGLSYPFVTAVLRRWLQSDTSVSDTSFSLTARMNDVIILLKFYLMQA